MIKLIDPKRQAELEEIIVQLGATVETLRRDVLNLQEANEALTSRLPQFAEQYRRLTRKVDAMEGSGFAAGGYTSRHSSPWDIEEPSLGRYSAVEFNDTTWDTTICDVATGELVRQGLADLINASAIPRGRGRDLTTSAESFL